MALQVAALLFGPPGGGSFVQAAEKGLHEASASAGAQLVLSHCASRALEDRCAFLERMAAHGADLIVVHGGQGNEPLARVALHWPMQLFAISQGEFLAPNVAGYEVLLEPIAGLAGALAAWSSRSGVIGHISGEAVGPGLRGRDAYVEGARAAVPGIDVLSVFCGDQHDPALAREHAGKQLRAGADVLFTMLGAGRDGVTDACRAARAWQIGDGIDWCAIAPDVFLASVYADAAWCCRQAIMDLAAGQLQTGQRRVAGPELPEVCRLITHPAIPVPVRQRLDRFSAAAHRAACNAAAP